jgi:hypothetical protein
MLMEEVSRIEGSARVFAVIAYRESRFVTSAHNGNAAAEQDERDSSRAPTTTTRAATRRSSTASRRPTSAAGACSALLAPYFLWTGVPEVGKKAPLSTRRPSCCSSRAPRPSAPRLHAAAARPLPRRRHRRHQGRLGQPRRCSRSGRGSAKYHDVRARFLADAMTLGIDLTDAATIPPKLDASAWPGVPAVFAGLVGALPKELA